MIPAADITDWLDHAVVDTSGSTIGRLEAVYFDTATEEPAFVTIKIGLIGTSRLAFAPLAGATVTPKAIVLAVDKKTVKDAPSIEPDGQLEASAEPDLYRHYGLPYATGSSGERRLGRR